MLNSQTHFLAADLFSFLNTAFTGTATSDGTAAENILFCKKSS